MVSPNIVILPSRSATAAATTVTFSSASPSDTLSSVLSSAIATTSISAIPLSTSAAALTTTKSTSLSTAVAETSTQVTVLPSTPIVTSTVPDKSISSTVAIASTVPPAPPAATSIATSSAIESSVADAGVPSTASGPATVTKVSVASASIAAAASPSSSTVRGPPPGTHEALNASPSSFFSNKGAVAATFTIVGLLVIAGLWFFISRLRVSARRRRLDEEMDAISFVPDSHKPLAVQGEKSATLQRTWSQASHEYRGAPQLGYNYSAPAAPPAVANPGYGQGYGQGQGQGYSPYAPPTVTIAPPSAGPIPYRGPTPSSNYGVPGAQQPGAYLASYMTPAADRNPSPVSPTSLRNPFEEVSLSGKPDEQEHEVEVPDDLHLPHDTTLPYTPGTAHTVVQKHVLKVANA